MLFCVCEKKQTKLARCSIKFARESHVFCIAYDWIENSTYDQKVSVVGVDAYLKNTSMAVICGIKHDSLANLPVWFVFFRRRTKSIKEIRRSLKSRGVLAMAVHGRDTPFYSSILKAVEKYIPEYKEPGTPDMARFST